MARRPGTTARGPEQTSVPHAHHGFPPCRHSRYALAYHGPAQDRRTRTGSAPGARSNYPVDTTIRRQPRSRTADLNPTGGMTASSNAMPSTRIRPDGIARAAERALVLGLIACGIILIVVPLLLTLYLSLFDEKL